MGEAASDLIQQVSFSQKLQQGDSIYPSANGPEVTGDTLSRLRRALSLRPHLAAPSSNATQSRRH